MKAFKEDAKEQFLLSDEQIEVHLRNGSLIEIIEEDVHRVAINATAHAVKKEDIKMKYESDILEMIHENATINFKLGFMSEARMREFDEMCLPEEALQGNTAGVNIASETVNVEHVDLVTA